MSRNRAKDEFVLSILFVCALVLAMWGCVNLILENQHLVRE
jgi:hypothetical protein